MTVEKAVDNGLFAAGFMAYEAAPGFDRAFITHRTSGIPLVWFGLYRQAEEMDSLPIPSEGTFTMDEWRPSVSQCEYGQAIDRIKQYIAAGDTYQVNYTMRLKTTIHGDPYAFFYSLFRAQQGNNSAFIHIDRYSICSVSPELFFERDGLCVVSRPMKGTAPRGLTYDADTDRAEALKRSEKDRAENIMIVDMIRNDLGRVATPGTVNVLSTFDIERYPTVFQMTSTVEAQTSASFTEIMAALFPCASVTGAPKVRTMEIIRELETEPRGVYTGAIGYLTPVRSAGDVSGPAQARFNVAIRTAVIDRESGAVEYGVGGGVVWESEAEDEYKECLAKALVLTVELPEFDLLETLLWSLGDGYFLLEPHLFRLSRSAKFFNFDFSYERIKARLMDFSASFASRSQRVRLQLKRDGDVCLNATPIVEKSAQEVLQVRLAADPIDSQNPFLYHKTTNRGMYDSAREIRADCDDVILYNERGEITETTTANIVIVLNEARVTPPVECGLLAGTFREQLLDSGEIREAVIKTADLEKAENIYLINSVRKWVPAKLSIP